MSVLVGAIFSVAAVATSTGSAPAGLHSEQEAIALADGALKRIVAGNVDEALELLRVSSGVEPGEFNNQAKAVANFFRVSPPGFGDPLSYAFVKKDLLGDSVLRVTFIEKFKHKPMMWDFFFYRAEQDWLLWEFHYASQATIMFNIPVPPPPPRPQ